MHVRALEAVLRDNVLHLFLAGELGSVLIEGKVGGNPYVLVVNAVRRRGDARDLRGLFVLLLSTLSHDWSTCAITELSDGRGTGRRSTWFVSVKCEETDEVKKVGDLLVRRQEADQKRSVCMSARQCTSWTQNVPVLPTWSVVSRYVGRLRSIDVAGVACLDRKPMTGVMTRFLHRQKDNKST